MASDRLAELVKEAEEKGVDSAALDEEVTACVVRVFVADPIVSQQQKEIEMAWESEAINDQGLEAQLTYLLKHHEFQWLHELLIDLASQRH